MGDFNTHHRGIAYVSSASATGKGKAKKAAALALSNVYSFKNYKDCKILLLTFSGGASLGLLEVNDILKNIFKNQITRDSPWLFNGFQF